jgi:hypothetical protein
MNNIDALILAMKIMQANNELCGYQTFKSVDLDTINETLHFDIEPMFIGEAAKITELLNLNLKIEANSDPSSEKTLNFYIK